MTTKVLTKIPTGNAKVLIEGNLIQLKSYQTIVAEIRDNWLTIYGLYSLTTRKHISAFVEEYCGFGYQLAKTIYEDGYKIDIITGEVVKIENV